MEQVQNLKFYQHLVNDDIKLCYKEFVDIINQKYHLLIEVA